MLIFHYLRNQNKQFKTYNFWPFQGCRIYKVYFFTYQFNIYKHISKRMYIKVVFDSHFFLVFSICGFGEDKGKRNIHRACCRNIRCTNNKTKFQVIYKSSLICAQVKSFDWSDYELFSSVKKTLTQSIFDWYTYFFQFIILSINVCEM